MKKRVLSIVLALMFVMTSVFSASALSLKEEFDKLGLPKLVTIKVPTNIQVKKPVNSKYLEGPIVVNKYASSDFPKFDFRAVIDMAEVKSSFKTYLATAKTIIKDSPELLAELDGYKLFGNFTIEVKYPNSLVIPDEFLEANKMSGFNPEALNAFTEVSRVVAKGKYDTTMTISVQTKNGLTVKEVEDKVDIYLADLILECKGVKTTKYETSKITGAVEGSLTLGSSKDPNADTFIGEVKFDFVKPKNESSLSASVSVAKINQGSGGIVIGGGGDSSDKGEEDNKKKPSLVFDFAGQTGIINPIVGADGKVTANLDEVVIPAKEGYLFGGFYSDKEFTQKIEGAIEFNEDTVIYGKWIKTNVPAALDATKHTAYVLGYPDGTVKPDGNITREEVATMLFRLLSDAEKAEIDKLDAMTFSDVKSDRWSYNEVGTLSKGKYILGYPDGTFGPEKNITRAEFVAIISRFADTEATAENITAKFTDITGHWAEKAIMTASLNEWVIGYEDDTFKPDQLITRAEVMQILNKVLVRFVNDKGIMKDAKVFPDCTAAHKLYYDVIEATNNHEYVRSADGYNETWTKLPDVKPAEEIKPAA